jgi:hypothetical protein
MLARLCTLSSNDLRRLKEAMHESWAPCIPGLNPDRKEKGGSRRQRCTGYIRRRGDTRTMRASVQHLTVNMTPARNVRPGYFPRRSKRGATYTLLNRHSVVVR